MEHKENFSGTNLREQVEKVLNTEELAYPRGLLNLLQLSFLLRRVMAF